MFRRLFQAPIRFSAIRRKFKYLLFYYKNTSLYKRTSNGIFSAENISIDFRPQRIQKMKFPYRKHREGIFSAGNNSKDFALKEIQKKSFRYRRLMESLSSIANLFKGFCAQKMSIYRLVKNPATFSSNSIPDRRPKKVLP